MAKLVFRCKNISSNHPCNYLIHSVKRITVKCIIVKSTVVKFTATANKCIKGKYTAVKKTAARYKWANICAVQYSLTPHIGSWLHKLFWTGGTAKLNGQKFKAAT